MIKKENLWFLTLFSLILVLSVYYITMPNELLLTNNNKQDKDKTVSVNKEQDASKVTVEESELLVAMRVSLSDERDAKVEELKQTLTNSEATSEDKNNAYEQIKYLNDIKGKETEIEQKIKRDFQLDNFVKIDNNEVKIVSIKKDHDATLANKIMRSVQEEFENKMYITVRFEK